MLLADVVIVQFCDHVPYKASSSNCGNSGTGTRPTVLPDSSKASDKKLVEKLQLRLCKLAFVVDDAYEPGNPGKKLQKVFASDAISAI